jgi:periplasmic divalent cation tolerance protein
MHDESQTGVGAAGMPKPEPVTVDPPDSVVLVLSSVDDPDQADEIARTLVDERLAACVNLLPGCRSIYRWQGRIEQADETLLLIKTTRNRRPAMEKRLLDLHPYDLPEIVTVAPDAVASAYAAWVIGETRRAFLRGGAQRSSDNQAATSSEK